jgi:hypothetical protein
MDDNPLKELYTIIYDYDVFSRETALREWIKNHVLKVGVTQYVDDQMMVTYNNSDRFFGYVMKSLTNKIADELPWTVSMEQNETDFGWPSKKFTLQGMLIK